MKVIILGCGFVGKVLSKLLDKEEKVSQIICCDLKHKEEKQGKLIFKKLDVSNKEQLAEFIRDSSSDIVINTLHPKFNRLILESCLANKVNYIDTASFWELDSNPKAKVPYKMEQLEYADAFKKNKLIGLINSGVAPGLDNLLAAQSASELDEVDYIKIRMVEDTGNNEIFLSWNKDWLLDELNSKPIIYENGKFKFVESFGDEEEYEFPAPIGKRKTCYFCQDEVGSIPFNIKTKKLDVKIYDNNLKVLKFLVALGLTSDKEIDIDGLKIKPVQVLSKLLPDSAAGEENRFPESIFALAVEAIGKKLGRKKSVKYSVIFPKQKEIDKLKLGANFISYPTALMLKTFIMNFSKIKTFGVFPPETLGKEIRKEIIDDLKKNGIFINVQEN